MSAIITSLLDTDLYKLTMMQCILHHFPATFVSYKFKCRNPGVDFSFAVEEINAELDKLCELRFSADELNFLSSLTYLTPDFIHFLRCFQLNREFISLSNPGEPFAVDITGPWLHTIMFEVPVLAIISEVYSRNRYPQIDYSQGKQRLQEKIRLVQQHHDQENFNFTDFGTRRRFNKHWQQYVVAELQQALPNNFTGTSNIYLAKELNLTPIGTMAHEFLQACQAMSVRLLDSQKFALQIWAQEFRGQLGIALTDILGIDAFLHDFDLYFTKLYDGLRHDSGDPFIWGQKVLAHYASKNVSTDNKTLVFSDKLTMATSLAIYDAFKQYIRMSFGIGTHLTNDLGCPTNDIVIKMTKANGQPVAKISDSPDKGMCEDETYAAYLKHLFNIK